MIYLDTSATTPMYEEVLDIIKKYGVENYFNPSALYSKALCVKKEIKQAKEKILSLLRGNGDICFTASGTEADNMVMFGSKKFKDCKILVSNVEHSAIYQCAKRLQMQGIDVGFVKTDRFGIVDMDDFVSNLDENVALVSIMHVCNETGGINDIENLCKMTKKVAPKAIFHSDGVQAVGKININLAKLGVDLYSFSAHKFHGMKGVGGLYIKKGVVINPIILGGGQENGLRSATENVGGIISTAFALEKTLKNLDEQKNFQILEYLAKSIQEIQPKVIFNTDLQRSVSNILSFALPNTRAEVLVHMLEDNGYIVGTGSACSSSKATARIPTALGLPKEYFDGVIRVSIDNMTSMQDIENFVCEFKNQYSILNTFMNG